MHSIRGTGVWLLVAILITGGIFDASAQLKPRPAVSDAVVGNLAPADAPVLGPLAAPVTIVEFFDPACEACRALYPHVKKVLAAHPGQVRLVLRYVPFHGDVSIEAIRALEAARLQKVFEPVLDILVARQPEWANHAKPSPQRIWEFAAAAGLDLERAKQDLGKGRIDAMIKRDFAAAKAVNIPGTPTFYVNERRLEQLGPQPLGALVAAEVTKTAKVR